MMRAISDKALESIVDAGFDSYKANVHMYHGMNSPIMLSAHVAGAFQASGFRSASITSGHIFYGVCDFPDGYDRARMSDPRTREIYMHFDDIFGKGAMPIGVGRCPTPRWGDEVEPTVPLEYLQAKPIPVFCTWLSVPELGLDIDPMPGFSKPETIKDACHSGFGIPVELDYFKCDKPFACNLKDSAFYEPHWMYARSEICTAIAQNVGQVMTTCMEMAGKASVTVISPEDIASIIKNLENNEGEQQ